MKIQCDVCEKREAAVFCAADEAVLCENCDKRVHYANKLASKHQRFSLLGSAAVCNNNKDQAPPPKCDICQERRAFLFCKEDRSILCRECDIQIHKTNEHTQKHNRFLLTGVKLSASSSIYPTSSSSTSSSNGVHNKSNTISYSNDTSMNTGYYGYSAPTVPACRISNSNIMSSSNGTVPVTTPTYCEEGSISTSSDYYTMDSPYGGGGWRLEDLIHGSNSSASRFFCKSFDYGMPSAEHNYHQ